MAIAFKTPEIKRGDVYYVRYDNTVGSEESIGRPAIVISSDEGNQTSPTINMVYLTSQFRSISVCPEVWSTKRRSWALCNQIITVDKQRLGDRMCFLSDQEMKNVDEALRQVLDLTLPPPPKVDVTTYETKIADLEKELAAVKADAEKKDLDCLISKQAYDKVLERLVEKQIEFDFLKKLAQAPVPPPVEPVVVEEKPTPVEEPKPEPLKPVALPEGPTSSKVNINTCTEQDLMKLGFSFTVARNITAARPFLKMDDLRVVPGMTKIGFQIAEPKITLGDLSVYQKPKKENSKPVKVEEPAQKTERVNINTCTYMELKEIVGCGLDKAYAITGYRKTHGPYSSVDDIIHARGMTQKWIDRNRDKLEV